MDKIFTKVLICIWLIVISFTTIQSASDQDLCNLCAKDGKSYYDHIYCMFPNPGPASKKGCRNVDISTITDSFRQKVLHWHNDYRNKFAEGTWPEQSGKNFPKAANMRYLHYDYQLEKLARRNVQNCYYNHEPCRRVGRFAYGQNLGYESHSDKNNLPPDSESTWNAWVNEMKDFDVKDVAEFGNGQHTGVVNHFVATTWAETRVVGCAQSIYETEGMYRIEVACNYGPAGVIVGLPMYLAGDPATKCPEGTKAGFNATFPNLCGGINNEDIPFFDPKEAAGTNVRISIILKILLACYLILVLDLRN
ncbi:venom allergen 3-like [Cimex lectularius]|uniref:SCP domain-containing protein n=1 Tax=Cimex lectularius TaxID=79782 RepID=A0A8I6TKA9_CIMLE|nr:venom allergen 3-like [Cimex lectularius]